MLLETVIDENVVRFYQRHWTVSEIVDLSSRILFSNANDEYQNEGYLRGLLEVLGWIGVA